MTTTTLRKQALDIFRAALKAADPVDSVVRTMRAEKFDRYSRIFVIGAGKAGASMAKGGQLARLAYPAAVMSLMLSDVIGDDIDVIGSAPTVPDASTFSRVKEIVDKYELWDRLPASVRQRLEAGLAGEIPETPKPGDP